MTILSFNDRSIPGVHRPDVYFRATAFTHHRIPTDDHSDCAARLTHVDILLGNAGTWFLRRIGKGRDGCQQSDNEGGGKKELHIEWFSG
jgi:hypothetical protein